jgi:exopolysaccharide biosynthesis polyprenyl glycosylphosphotransferase
MSAILNDPTGFVTVVPSVERRSARAGRSTRSRLRGTASGMAVTDTTVLVLAFLIAHAVRFPMDRPFMSVGPADLLHAVIGLVIVLVWSIALAGLRTRDPRIIGVGQDEYRRLITATLTTIALVAVCSYAVRFDLARGYVAVAFPLGLLLLCIGRKAWRSRVARLRTRGELLTDVLLVGDLGDLEYVGAKIAASPATGYRVAAVVTDCRPVGSSVACGADRTLVVGAIEDIVDVARSKGVSAVVLAGAVAGGHDRLRRIGWELEELGVELVVSSPLVDIAQTRVHHRPVDGLPLMHVESPDYSRVRVGKRVLDAVGAAVGLLLLAPVFAIIAVSIRVDDGGPVFFRQTRIGRGGMPFRICKFRTMCTDAESRVTDLEQLNDGAGPLFKIKDDPRVTRVGAFLRRTSLDELPQLWNVLVGTMSLVGPRPALPREVAVYADFADRRLLVTPGITGLWQVSGRSDLDWAEGVRLDLHYVENWSFVHDLVILGRTIPSVIRSRGAY